MSHAVDAQRGELARQVLDNPVYIEAHGLIEKELIRIWRESRDAHEREQTHQLLRMLDKVQTVMRATMMAGQVSVSELQRKQGLAERIGQRFVRD